MNKNIQTFIACDCDYNDADIVLFGVPFDGTVSFRPGTRFGPPAIRNESYGIETYSPYSDRDLTDIAVTDIGDLDLPFGNPARVLDMTEEITSKILDDGKLPFMIGGEHLVTLGAVRAVYKKYPELCVIHLDAHTDLRDEYIGEELTHAGVIKQVWRLVGDKKIHQFGIRSGERYEFRFAEEHNYLRKFDLEGFEKAIEIIGSRPVYFTLDLDVLDPSIMSGTGTPEAGGVTFKELINVLTKLDSLNIVGCDVNELAPHYDQSGTSTAVACKTVREILLQLRRK